MTIAARFRVGRGDFSLDVDLELPPAGFTALFGPSGCGKTTLLRTLAGLERVAGGCLRFGDETWQDGSHFIPTHRRPIGYVFQEASLFDHLDVLGNLEYGARRARRGGGRVTLEEVIEWLGIGDLLQRAPASLSGGERQRVAIARALAVRPDLLLMDEPLASLDLERKREILPYLESLHRALRIPVIYVSHQPEEVSRLADHMVLMDAGRVIASGPVPAMFTRLDLPLAHGFDAAAVIEARVTGHDESFHLTHLDFPGGRLTTAREDLPTGSTVRLRVAARDVSLTLEPQSGTSILNILPARIDALAPEGRSQETVRLAVGDTPLLARVTRKSVALLDLRPGKRVYAQVKSIAVLA
jgi:molybdate transport system ATP-binding protein